MRTAMTLIRLFGCQGWPESLPPGVRFCYAAVQFELEFVSRVSAVDRSERNLFLRHMLSS